MVMSELKRPPDPEILQFFYLKQAQHFWPLGEDIAYYRRAKLLADASD